MYAMDDEFRNEYQRKILDEGVKCKMKKCPAYYVEMANYDSNFSTASQFEPGEGDEEEGSEPER